MSVAILRKTAKNAVMAVALLGLQACMNSSGHENYAAVTVHKQTKEMAYNPMPPQKPDWRDAGYHVAGYYIDEPIQCVPYARKVSGFPIYGDAHTWWGQAANKGYERGQDPMPGSVLVLKKGRKLNYGHVAVVKKILSDREIEVAHSNWGSDRKTRSFIYERMRVKDVSRGNDWSKLRFWNKYSNAYGSVYPNHGFIYPPQQLAAADISPQ